MICVAKYIEAPFFGVFLESERGFLTRTSSNHLVAVLGSLLIAAPVSAQLPDPQQIQQLLQQQPGLADVARQRIAQSGLSADQIRARLRAAGYPASLLDSYLGGVTPAGGATSAAGFPAQLAALQALGCDST